MYISNIPISCEYLQYYITLYERAKNNFKLYLDFVKNDDNSFERLTRACKESLKDFNPTPLTVKGAYDNVRDLLSRNEPPVNIRETAYVAQSGFSTQLVNHYRNNMQQLTNIESLNSEDFKNFMNVNLLTALNVNVENISFHVPPANKDEKHESNKYCTFTLSDASGSEAGTQTANYAIAITQRLNNRNNN